MAGGIGSPVAVQIVFRHSFPLAVAAEPRGGACETASEAVVARWVSCFGPVSRTADFEDWHEEAAKLFAAVDSGFQVFVLADGPRAEGFVRSFNTGRETPDPGVPVWVVGTVASGDIPPGETCSAYRGGRTWLSLHFRIVLPDHARMSVADRYWANPAFERHAGRLVVPCGIDDDGPDSLSGVVDAISKVASERGTAVAVKVVSAAKYGPVEYGCFPDPFDRADISSWLYRTFEYGLVHTRGRLPAFLVQEKVHLVAEYRVVVVGGVPVAGAGCIESMCPPCNPPRPDGRGIRFHPVVEGTRGGGHLSEAPALVARYVSAASVSAADMVAADTLSGDGTFDFGLLPDGRVALIEVNPLGNFGLYAMDYGHVIDALAAALESRKPPPHPCPGPPGR